MVTGRRATRAEDPSEQLHPVIFVRKESEGHDRGRDHASLELNYHSVKP